MSSDGTLTCDEAFDRKLTLTASNKVAMAAEDVLPTQQWRLIRWVNPNVSMDSDDDDDEEEEDEQAVDGGRGARFLGGSWAMTDDKSAEAEASEFVDCED
eukprot:5434232-Pyramimonas_sp.AAC.1